MASAIKKRLFELQQREANLAAKVSLLNEAGGSEFTGSHSKTMAQTLFDVRVRIRNLSRNYHRSKCQIKNKEESDGKADICSKEHENKEVLDGADISGETTISKGELEELKEKTEELTESTACEEYYRDEEKEDEVFGSDALFEPPWVLEHKSPIERRLPTGSLPHSRAWWPRTKRAGVRRRRQIVVCQGQFSSVGEEGGDWRCPCCTASNYSLARECRRCGKLRVSPQWRNHGVEGIAREMERAVVLGGRSREPPSLPPVLRRPLPATEANDSSPGKAKMTSLRPKLARKVPHSLLSLADLLTPSLSSCTPHPCPEGTGTPSPRLHPEGTRHSSTNAHLKGTGPPSLEEVGTCRPKLVRRLK